MKRVWTFSSCWKYQHHIGTFPLQIIATGIVFLVTVTGAMPVQAQHMKQFTQQRHMHHHGADGIGHDEVNMPGLRGENASAEESEELAVLFRNFQTLSREVTNLPNGIRTVTSSSDEAVMAALVSHVTGMINRVETADDPKIFIQSPTLDIFFARGDKLENAIEITDAGIVVTQTSDDAELVKALHIHAAEVSAMADRGMHAVHEMMMKRHGNRAKN